MKIHFYIFLAISILFICNYAKAQDIAILPDMASISVNLDELQLIQTLLEKCIHQYNADAKEKINLSDYKRQYIISFNSQQEKEVWINCFCQVTSDDWKKNVVVVKDGGQCYFRLKINLVTKTCYDMSVNGKA